MFQIRCSTTPTDCQHIRKGSKLPAEYPYPFWTQKRNEPWIAGTLNQPTHTGLFKQREEVIGKSQDLWKEKTDEVYGAGSEQKWENSSDANIMDQPEST